MTSPAPALAAPKTLRVAFVHPDLGIGGAERLVVDAALGLQNLGHDVDVYTSHHDPNHCFEETVNGQLKVHHIKSLLPRSILGKFHILLAQLRQLHLTFHLVQPFTSAGDYDIFVVDQLSTCIPLLQTFGQARVVFYCHFPDKLLAQGAFVEGQKPDMSFLKRMYRVPMDYIEEYTTSSADVILANSNFTARVFRSHFPSITRKPKTVYPGINIAAYQSSSTDAADVDISTITSDRLTFLSINRFEKKKNVALAVEAFTLFRQKVLKPSQYRLVLAGGYDPRVQDNKDTLEHLVQQATKSNLSYRLLSASSATLSSFQDSQKEDVDVLFLLNFTTAQRTHLLNASSTRALLYTPTNEHFGIGPVEGMIAGLPVLATDTGGPTETIISSPPSLRTGWLEDSVAETWCRALEEIIELSEQERADLGKRAKERAGRLFSMEAMAKGLNEALNEAVAMGSLKSEEGVIGYGLMFVIFFISCWVSYKVTPMFAPPVIVPT